MSGTNPADLFGFGTWEQITDRFLYCSSTSKTTGGSETHKHTTGDCTLTVAQMPAHNHCRCMYAGYNIINGGAEPTGAYNGLKMVDSSKPENAFPDDFHSIQTNSTGGSQAHNHGDTGSASNMPPYMTVFAWYRTA